MDPGWVGSPPGSLRCVLCSVLLPRYAEPLFRHLIEDHRAQHNLNLLLEFSVGGGIWLPPSPPPEVPLYEGSPVASSPKPRESKIPWPWNPLANHLPETTSAYDLRPIPSASRSKSSEVTVAEETPKQVPSYDGQAYFQDPVGIKTTLEEQSMHEGVQVKDVTWDETGSFSSQPSPPTLRSHPVLLPRQPMAPMHPDPAAAALTFPEFSIRDPIAHIQPRQQFMRRTRDELVKRNNRAQVMMNGPPTRNIVTEELQHRIVTNNQGRSVHFTKSQRDNVQLVLDDYILKKKKGPFMSRGMQVISWRCTAPGCPFTASTKEGSIVEGRKAHSHPARPDLVEKKEVYARVRQLVSLEENTPLSGGTAASLVQEAVGDRQAPNDAIKQVIKDSEVWSVLRSKIQAARRYRRRSSGARSVKEVEDLKEWQMYGEDAEQHGWPPKVPGDAYANSLVEVTLPGNYMEQASPICGTFASIPTIPGVNPSTVEVVLNPETLDVSLTHPEVKIVYPDAPTSSYAAAPRKSAETSKFELAHSSVPKVHLEVQSPLDPSAKVKKEESECHTRNKENASEVAASIEFVPDLSFKSSSLVYVSDFTEDSDNGHENIGETREGDDKEQGINLISNTLIGATKNDALNMTALENESLDTKLQPTDVRDEIEDFDEKVARVKAKLDLENSEEAKAVEAVMAGLKEKYSQSGGVGHCEDGKMEDEQKVVIGKHVQECIDINMPLTKEVKVVEAYSEALGSFERGEVEAGLVDGRVDDQEEVERHVQECIENVIEHGRRNIVKALEGGSEEHIQEGGVDVGLKAKRKLRRQRWSWL